MNFKDRVIKIVKKIPYGRVTTYGTVATLAGLPRGARLVGGILHFNSENESSPPMEGRSFPKVNRLLFLPAPVPSGTGPASSSPVEGRGIRRSENKNLPWQRIINRHGFISTKCLEHPKQLQKALLEQEGVAVSKDFMVDLKKYYWP